MDAIAGLHNAIADKKTKKWLRKPTTVERLKDGRIPAWNDALIRGVNDVVECHGMIRRFDVGIKPNCFY